MAPKTANNLEIKYIKKYNTYNDGYNSTLGGEGTQKYDANFKNKIIKMYQKGKTQVQISEELGCSVKTIYRFFKKEGIQTRKEKSPHAKVNSNSTAVECFDIETGKTVYSFRSKYMAAKFFSTNEPSKNHINDCIMGKRKTCFGYGWRLLTNI